MLFDTEYPQIYSTCNIKLDILSKPIVWFKPYLTSIGQFFLYNLKVKPFELKTAKQLTKTIIKTEEGTEIMVAMSNTAKDPDGIVLYLHTVCGNYTQLAHISHMTHQNNMCYVSYTRSGNDSSLIHNKFNFVGCIEELQLVIRFIKIQYPNVPIHAIAASAGSALLIRYMGKYNEEKLIKSAVLVSPGFNFIQSVKNMSNLSKAYLVNKMKYMIRGSHPPDELKSIKSLDDWLEFQSRILGYNTIEDYVRDCDPVNYLHKINVPTLCISSLDDTIFTGDITKQYLNLPNINKNVMLVVTKRGGHVMFEDEGYQTPWFLRVSEEWLRYQIKK